MNLMTFFSTGSSVVSAPRGRSTGGAVRHDVIRQVHAPAVRLRLVPGPPVPAESHGQVEVPRRIQVQDRIRTEGRVTVDFPTIRRFDFKLMLHCFKLKLL